MYGQFNYRLDIWRRCLPYIYGYGGHLPVCFQSDAVLDFFSDAVSVTKRCKGHFFPMHPRATINTLLSVIWNNEEATMDSVLADSLVLVQNALTVVTSFEDLCR